MIETSWYQNIRELVTLPVAPSDSGQRTNCSISQLNFSKDLIAFHGSELYTENIEIQPRDIFLTPRIVSLLHVFFFWRESEMF